MANEVEEIKARLNIVELVGSYVKLVKAGSHWKAPCPFHHEKSPSFMVNEERQIWHCFGCQKGGDAFSFLMEIEGIDFREALRILAERTGVELARRGTGETYAAPKSRSMEILELATKFYEKQLWDGAGKSRALPYLTGRGLREESLRAFRLGYAPKGWRNMLDFLVARGFEAEEVVQAGLSIAREKGDGHYDRFRERIMFPIMDALGRVVGFSARVEPGADESQAKYINTPETDVYHKSRALYGIQRAKQAMKQQDFVLLVEGNVDVVAAQQAGFENTIAVSGTALTDEQLKIIKRYTRRVRMFFDMDSAGQQAARRSAELALRAGMDVSIVSIEGGKDAAELAQHDPQALRQAIGQARPAMVYFLDRLLVRYNRHDPEGRKQIVEDYAGLLACIPDDLGRSTWLHRLADAVEAEERLILPLVESAMKSSQMSHGTPETQLVSAQSSEPAVFSKRSEALRHKVVLLALLDAKVWELFGSVSDEVTAFLRQDQAYGLAERMGKTHGYVFSDMMGSTEDKHEKDLLIGRFFEGERFLAQEGLSGIEEEERSGQIVGLARGFLAELGKELGREALLSLERAMKQARESGDRALEKQLHEEFARRLQGTE